MWYSSSINLASISDKNENDFIQKLSNFSMWIGLESRGVFRGKMPQLLNINFQF